MDTHKYRKAQVSNELVILISILMLLFIIIIGVMIEQRRSIPSQERLQADVLANKIAQSIDALAVAPPGTRAIINLPGGNYTLRIIPEANFVSVTLQKEEVTASLQTRLVQGILQWQAGTTMRITKGDEHVDVS